MLVCHLLILHSLFLLLWVGILYVIMSVLCTDGEENYGSFESSGKSTHDQVLSSESQVIGELVENLVDDAKDDVKMPKPAAESETPDSHNEDDKVGAPEKNDSVNNSNGKTGSPSPKEGTTKGFLFFLLAINLSQIFH